MQTYIYLFTRLCLYKSRYAVGGVRRKLGFKLSNAAERASPASHFLAPFPTRLLPTSIPWKRSPFPLFQSMQMIQKGWKESECTSRTNRECSSKLNWRHNRGVLVLYSAEKKISWMFITLRDPHFSQVNFKRSLKFPLFLVYVHIDIFSQWCFKHISNIYQVMLFKLA